MSYNVQRSHFKSFTFPCSKLFLNFLAGPARCELLSFNREPAKRNNIVNATPRKQAGDLMVEEEQRIPAEYRLSAESSGHRMLRSEHGTFLRAYDYKMKVDLAPEAREWEHWYVEDHGGKVVFKAIHFPGKFMRAHSDGGVDLTMAHPHDCDEEYWIPLKHDDSSWSFRSIHGLWLAGLGDGVVKCEPHCGSSEHFWLETW